MTMQEIIDELERLIAEAERLTVLPDKAERVWVATDLHNGRIIKHYYEDRPAHQLCDEYDDMCQVLDKPGVYVDKSANTSLDNV